MAAQEQTSAEHSNADVANVNQRARELADELTLMEAAALLSGASEWDSRALPHRGIPGFVMSDGPHGVRRQLGSGDHLGIAKSEEATCFPTAATVAHSWDPALAQRMGQALGQEARALGVDVLLGPGMNIKRSLLCGRNFEYYSEDPLLAGRVAASFIKGVQSEGVAVTPKHFAVNSQEMRRMASDSIVDERTLREIYLTAFEIAVKEAKPRALMSSYNLVNGTYAHENHHLLTEILREEWGFDGMVVSDWGGSNYAEKAVAAGGSLEMPAPGLASVREIVAAVESGELAEADVRARAAEVIAIALSAPSVHADASTRPTIEALKSDHHALAQEIAESTLTLLKNEGQVLPLAADVRIALIGDMAENPRYQGAGSSLINPTQVDSLVSTVEQQNVTVVARAQGYDRFGNARPDLVEEAVAVAKKADVAVVAIGLPELYESEGIDRQHMQMPDVQVQLLEALATTDTPVVAVLFAGAPVETQWMQYVDALVHANLPGQAGGSAVWRVLTGEVNPSGHLTEAWPIALSDHPTAGKVPQANPQSLYEESLYVGYRYFTSTGTPTAFPFGYGLSYTEFTYSDLRIDGQGAHVTVSNTGQRDGADVVQLYVSRPGKVWGPRTELKGFAKVQVAAGQSVEVTITFDEYTFRHFNTATGQWDTEAGQWTIRVASDSVDAGVSAPFDIAEGVTTSEDIPEVYRTGDVRTVATADFRALMEATQTSTIHPIATENPHASAKGRYIVGQGDPLGSMTHVRNPLARLVGKILHNRLRAAEKKGKADLNILFINNMPFRALAKMTHGGIDRSMVDALLIAVNGHLFKGMGRLVTAAMAKSRADKETRQAIFGHEGM